MDPISWQGLNEIPIPEKVDATVIGYEPFIALFPTNPDVVMESVDYCMGVTKYIDQSHCILTCDQATYGIVLALKANIRRSMRISSFVWVFAHIAQNFEGGASHIS